MTDAISGGVPLPPKRPTIIRPSSTQNTDEDAAVTSGRPVPQRPAPARPAPPPPGGGGGSKLQPAIPNRPPHKGTTDGETRGPPPSASAVPSRPHIESNSSEARASVKKRPEITILSAKPMSEVGFRGDTSPREAVSEKPTRPTRPVPSPQPNHKGEVPSRPQPPPGRPHPPPPNRSSTSGQQTSNQISLLDDDFGQSDLPPPIPLSQPPPLTANLLDLEPDVPPQARSPPPASRPPAPPPRPDLSGESRPLPSRPPPLPSRPKVSGDDDSEQPPTPPTRISSIQRSQEDTSPPAVASRGIPPVPVVTPGLTESTGEDNESNKVLPPKPLRPTIIRPGKPMTSPRDVKPNLPANVFDDCKSDEAKQPAVQTDLSNSDITAEPEYAKIDKPKSRPNNIGRFNKDSNFDESESVGHGLPFKVKLRSTVTTHDNGADRTQTGDDSSPPALPPKQFDETGSPPSTKPKPTVLPKPKPSPDKEDTNITESDTKTDTRSENIQISKPAGKRPTIIRPPPKPKRLHDTEDESSDTGVKNLPETDPEVSMRKMPPVPAKRPNSINTSLEPSQTNNSQEGSTSPRPVPAKRPASVAARFEQQIQKETQSAVPMRRPPPPKKSPVTGKSAESSPDSSKNVIEEEASHKHITPPKPKARTRTTPVESSPESPPAEPAGKQDNPEESTGVSRPPPPRPSGRPRSMVVPTTPDSEGDGEATSRPPPPRPAGRPLSMVLPKHATEDFTKDSEDGSKSKPPRPGGQPQRKSLEDAFREEEETLPKTGPPRPTGRPVSVVAPRRTSEEQSTEEDEDSLKAKPPRPTGPPPPKQSPPQKEDDGVQRRPPRPQGGPSRPTSTPVKPPQPSGGLPRSRPPKPSPSKAGGKIPDLPPRPGPDHQLYHYILTVPHALAKHNYDASQKDELTFKTDDIVVLVRRIDSDWLVGRVRDREGMFPAGFVEIIHPLHDEIPDFAMKQPAMPSWDDEPESESVKKSVPSVTSGPRCVARFDFDGEGKDDLTFEEDDVIKLVGRVGTEWLRGELNGKIGIFPIAFVEIVEDLPPETIEDSSDGLVTAMFDFDGRGDELSFQAGQKLKILSEVNTEWLYGEADGQRGKFPSAFIDHIPSGLPPYEQANQDSEKMSADPVSTNHRASVEEPFVEAIRNTDSSSVDQSKPYCVANHDYEGQHEDDLSFKTGEIIQLLEKVGADWLRGSCNGNQGMFPAGFVTVEKDLPDTPDNQLDGCASASSSPSLQGRALFDFDGESDKELTFKTGEIIILGEVVSGSPDWQYGSINGKTGMFPRAFVEAIS